MDVLLQFAALRGFIEVHIDASKDKKEQKRMRRKFGFACCKDDSCRELHLDWEGQIKMGLKLS